MTNSVTIFYLSPFRTVTILRVLYEIQKLFTFNPSCSYPVKRIIKDTAAYYVDHKNVCLIYEYLHMSVCTLPLAPMPVIVLAN